MNVAVGQLGSLFGSKLFTKPKTLWGFEEWKGSFWSFQGATWLPLSSKAAQAVAACNFVKSKYASGNPLIRAMVWNGSGWQKGPSQSLSSFLSACSSASLASLFGTRFPSTPSTPPAPSGNPTIQLGSTGPYVTECQTILVKIGFYIYVTGNFDAATQNAVMNFQSTHGIPVNGIVGPATWDALYKAAGPPE